MFSCWVVKTEPIAVKYVKNESFKETTLMSVKQNFMVCSTSRDMSYFSYTKKIRIPKAKSTTIQFNFSKENVNYTEKETFLIST